MNSVVRRFLRNIPRQALIVYLLIDAGLIGFFFNDPFKIEILAKCGSQPTLYSKGLNMFNTWHRRILVNFGIVYKL